jgi:hypothetical protein
MNVEIGTETPIFLFWEYLFRNFGNLSLQCVRCTVQFNPLFNCTYIKDIHTVQYSISGLNSDRTRYKKPVSRPDMKGGGR